MIPQRLELHLIQDAFRQVDERLNGLLARNIDMSQRRVVNAGVSIGPFDYVTRTELDKLMPTGSPSPNPSAIGLLNAPQGTRSGAYSTRGSAAAHANEWFLASDRDYIGFYSTGAIWVYASGTHFDVIANRPMPTSDETNYQFYATDSLILYQWDGSAWVALINAYPAAKDTIALPGKTADIASTNFVNSSTAGTYRVAYSLETTTADATAGTVTVSFAFTSGAGSTTIASAALALTAVGLTQGIIHVQLSSGSIAYSTSHTGVYGTAQYALYATLERLS